ncbi:Hypothetical protein FKW44_024164 [Caligus rogercresseyi]|uniref:Uncharacterized protein n=1 Tax=Caligus rogercresseyi TaxID=217165 RepID=A0A7T8JU59_CALRO|nr:Hypothetical protein FKW44_024164 [Caligus rogercresseyi]
MLDSGEGPHVLVDGPEAQVTVIAPVSHRIHGPRLPEAEFGHHILETFSSESIDRFYLLFLFER